MKVSVFDNQVDSFKLDLGRFRTNWYDGDATLPYVIEYFVSQREHFWWGAVVAAAGFHPLH